MNERKPPANEDAGYGNSSLVGSDRAGERSAIEARQAVERARDRPDADSSGDDVDLGRLARPTPDGTLRAGASTGADGRAGSSMGTRASAGRNDADRDPDDGGNTLQD